MTMYEYLPLEIGMSGRMAMTRCCVGISFLFVPLDSGLGALSVCISMDEYLTL